MILPTLDLDKDCTRICLECDDREAYYCKNVQIKGDFSQECRCYCHKLVEEE